HDHVARVRARQAVDVAQRDALSGAGRPQHAEDLAPPDLEVDARQDVAARVSLPDLLELDDDLAAARGTRRRDVRGGDGSAHQIARKSLVRKKSDTRIEIDARTTVRVVDRPTAAAPPSTCRPL